MSSSSSSASEDEVIPTDREGRPLSNKNSKKTKHKTISNHAEIDLNLIARFYRISKTIYQLLHDRGYLIFEEDLNMEFNTFKNSFHNIENHLIYSTHADDQNDSILVCFDHDSYNSENQKQPVLTGNQFLDILTRHTGSSGLYPDVKNKILVTNKKLGGTAIKKLGMQHDGSCIECFYEQELLINITDHSLVGIFKLLNSTEKQEMLEKYRIQESELPRIGKNDNISRYYGAKQGDVFKVIRKSEIAGRYLYYRIVQ